MQASLFRWKHPVLWKDVLGLLTNNLNIFTYSYTPLLSALSYVDAADSIKIACQNVDILSIMHIFTYPYSIFLLTLLIRVRLPQPLSSNAGTLFPRIRLLIPLSDEIKMLERREL